MADSSDTPEDDLTGIFLTLLSEHERALAIYVTGMVGSTQDSQDILQEGKLVMWRNFKSFEQGTNFRAWGRKILFHQVLSWRKRSKRHAGLFLSEKTIGLLHAGTDSATREKRWIDRERALFQCLENLKDEHRSILNMRYRDEASIEKISRHTGKSEGAVYRLLSRLRKSLYECIEKSPTA